MTSNSSQAWDVAEDDPQRSLYVRRLLEEPPEQVVTHSQKALTPKVIVQYWNDQHSIPRDVRECMESWGRLESSGFSSAVFDDTSAAGFIKEQFSDRHHQAFSRCTHPAMRADYFRLCYIFECGGFYIDADDEYYGVPLDGLASDGRLLLAPLCYDLITDSMADPHAEAHGSASSDTKIFYVNNNPLIAPKGHPLIRKALERATSALLQMDEGDRDIQSLTGPGNLTASLVAHSIEHHESCVAGDFSLLEDWNSVASSKWPLEYRSDERNWRRWADQSGGSA